jgi:hypothetical protein
METIQIEAPAPVLDAQVVIEVAKASAFVVATALTGVEARLAQATNLTSGVKPLRLPYFAA